MMKRAVSVLLSAALMLSVLTGCGKSGSVSKKKYTGGGDCGEQKNCPVRQRHHRGRCGNLR